MEDTAKLTDYIDACLTMCAMVEEAVGDEILPESANEFVMGDNQRSGVWALVASFKEQLLERDYLTEKQVNALMNVYQGLKKWTNNL
jgi:hypothetical protein